MKNLFVMNEDKENSKGIVVILFAVTLITLLTMLGLVIDSSNIYAARLKTSAAADAAVIAAVSARMSEQNPAILAALNACPATGLCTAERNYLENRGITSATANLIANGILPANSNPLGARIIEVAALLTAGTNIITNPDSLTVTTSALVPTLIMRLLPGNTSAGSLVTSSATAGLPATNFLFLLDLSASQKCPAGEDNCVCNTPARTVDCRQAALATTTPANLVGRLRSESLVNAMTNAMRRLDSRRDRVSIIGFNNSAFTIIPFRPTDPALAPAIAAAGFNQQGVISALRQIVPYDFATQPPPIPAIPPIYNFTDVTPNGTLNINIPRIIPQGNSNISDAILTGYQEALASRLFGTSANGAPIVRENIHMILYSDGAATALRSSFLNLPNNISVSTRADRAPRQLLNSIAPTPLTTNDSYPKLWDNDTIMFDVIVNNGVGGVIATPGPMIYTPLYKRNYIKRLNDSANLLLSTDNQVAMAPADFVGTLLGFPNEALPTCHKEAVAPFAFNARILNFDLQTRINGWVPCMTSGGVFTDSFGGTMLPTISNEGNYGASVKLGTVTDTSLLPNTPALPISNLYYMAALEAAELMRRAGGKINVVAYGKESSIINSPSQDPFDRSGVKGAFLSNLASNYDAFSDPIPTKNIPAGKYKQYTEYSDNQYGGKRRGSATNDPNGQETLKKRKEARQYKGQVFISPTADGLERMIIQLVSIIKLKMISVN